MCLALATGAIFFVGAAWLGSLPLLNQILTDPALTLDESLRLIGPLLTYSLFEFTSYSLLYTLMAAGLLGINVALLVFYLRLSRALPKSGMASGIVGITAAVIGFGCAACGSIFFASLLGTFGGAGLIALMPYGGAEVGIVGLALLGLSMYTLTNAINKPRVCPI